MRYIASRGSATVTEVGDHLTESKGQTRNTALNMMERLRKKGFLARKKVEGIYRYAPAIPNERLFEGFVEDFVEGILGGSVSPLVAYLTHRTQVDEKQLEELRQMVRSLEEPR